MTLLKQISNNLYLLNPYVISRIIKGLFRSVILKKNVLRIIEIQINTVCNSKCTMCFASKFTNKDKKYLSLKEIKDVWEQAKNLGAFAVCITGGEPTLRKDWIKLIEILEPKKNVVTFITNALVIKESDLDKLKKIGIKTIVFSLDGINAKDNDKIRGIKGHFNKVMNLIAYCKKIGIKVNISATVHRKNVGYLKKMLIFTHKLDVDITFAPASIMGKWTGKPKYRLRNEDWLKLIGLIKNNSNARCDWDVNYTLKRECPAGREKICIGAYGDVMGCQLNHISFGNIREESLNDILKRMNKFYHFKKRSKKCLIGVDKDYQQNYLDPLWEKNILPARINK